MNKAAMPAVKASWMPTMLNTCGATHTGASGTGASDTGASAGAGWSARRVRGRRGLGRPPAVPRRHAARGSAAARTGARDTTSGRTRQPPRHPLQCRPARATHLAHKAVPDDRVGEGGGGVLVGLPHLHHVAAGAKAAAAPRRRAVGGRARRDGRTKRARGRRAVACVLGWRLLRGVRGRPLLLLLPGCGGRGLRVAPAALLLRGRRVAVGSWWWVPGGCLAVAIKPRRPALAWRRRRWERACVDRVHTPRSVVCQLAQLARMHAVRRLRRRRALLANATPSMAPHHQSTDHSLRPAVGCIAAHGCGARVVMLLSAALPRGFWWC
jgi:hypothetical protein